MPSAGTFLGFKDQESDDISRLFIELYPGRSLPSFISCMATPRGMKGVRQCKSLVCRRCHAQRQADLRRRLADALLAGQNAGAGMYFITTTVPHLTDISLSETMKLLKQIWKSACRGPHYKSLSNEHGLWGMVPVPELTYGANGWHFHVHIILFASDLSNAAFCAEMIKERYLMRLTKIGLLPSDRTVDLRPVDDPIGLADYLSKDWRRTSVEGETPLMLLQKVKRGDRSAATLFFEAASALENVKRGVVHSHLAKKIREAGKHPLSDQIDRRSMGGDEKR